MQLGELDAVGERRRVRRIEASGADLAHGRCARGDRGSDRVVRRALIADRREELASRTSPEPTPGDRLDVRRERSDPPRLAADAHEGEAAVLERDEDVARAHLGDRIERHQEVVVVLELLADELLGLTLVRRDEERAGLDGEAERLALRVENDADITAREIADGASA